MLLSIFRMDEYNLLKVSDFGLSQEIYGKTYFRQAEGEETKLPIKWMAIESMTDGLFSEKTDVVSIGHTLLVLNTEVSSFQRYFCIGLYQLGHCKMSSL